MDFGLSEDQKLLESSVRSFLADRVPIERVRTLRDLPCPYDRGIWQELAGLGVTGILVGEAEGGTGLGMLDAALVAQALGHAVTPSPFLSTAVMAPIALRACDGDAARAWLAGIASGELLFGVAVTETFSIREGAGVTLADGTLRGKAMMAQDIGEADYLLVAVGHDQLAVVRSDAPGLTTTTLATIDATRSCAELVFEGVTPELVHTDAATVTRVLDAGRIGLAADNLGAGEAMIAQAVAYAQERKQFNRVIGSFQAVKHMCAEMIAELEPARSLVWYAAHSFDALPDETPVMARHALAHTSEIGRQIASVATQVHGGTGWTDEQNLHFWFKRLGVGRHLLGGPELLREQAAALQGLVPDAAAGGRS